MWHLRMESSTEDRRSLPVSSGRETSLPQHPDRHGLPTASTHRKRHKQLHLKSRTLHMQKVSRSERGQMFFKNWLSEIHHLILHIFLRIPFKLTLLKNKLQYISFILRNTFAIRTELLWTQGHLLLHSTITSSPPTTERCEVLLSH